MWTLSQSGSPTTIDSGYGPGEGQQLEDASEAIGKKRSARARERRS